MTILYHGSNVVVDEPKLLPQTRTLDFGPGFYTTANRDQAVAFARKVMIRTSSRHAFVSLYEYDTAANVHGLNVLKFSAPDREWLDFVYQNRGGIYEGTQYDVIIGAVANDDVYRVLIAYEDGLFSREETIEKLKVRKLYDQYVFATPNALAKLKFLDSFPVV
jgi:hypothetical protein